MNNRMTKLMNSVTENTQYCYNCGHSLLLNTRAKMICTHCGITNYNKNADGEKQYFIDHFKRAKNVVNQREYEARRYGTNPMKDNQVLSNESVDKEKRYLQIKEILKGKQMTFREIAKAMYENGYTPSPETTYSQPRVTELVQKGVVEPIGKVKSNVSGKSVTLFQLREEV